MLPIFSLQIVRCPSFMNFPGIATQRLPKWDTTRSRLTLPSHLKRLQVLLFLFFAFILKCLLKLAFSLWFCRLHHPIWINLILLPGLTSKKTNNWPIIWMISSYTILLFKNNQLYFEAVRRLPSICPLNLQWSPFFLLLPAYPSHVGHSGFWTLS